MVIKLVLYLLIAVSLVAVGASTFVFYDFPILTMIASAVVAIVYDLIFVGQSVIEEKREFLSKKKNICMLSSVILVMGILITWITKCFNTISGSMNLFYVACVIQAFTMIVALTMYSTKGRKFAILNLLLVLAATFSTVVEMVLSFEGIVIVLGILAVGFGVYNLIKGKKTENKNRSRLGKAILIGLAVIFGIVALNDYINLDLIITVAFVGYLVFVLLYSIKHKILSGKVFSVITSVIMVAIILLNSSLYMINDFGSVQYAAESGVSYMTGNFNTSMPAFSAMDSMASNKTIGFSVGGAKDINNFRENIKNGYLPLLTDITYEGLFYDYYFDTGKVEAEDEMFYPSYSYASSNDPLSGEQEQYLSVGLNSNIKESDFMRKKLNLVIVLDISGSMDSSFNSYYYDTDKLGEIFDSMEEIEDRNKSKMQIANESVNILLDQLNDNDKFGLVLFESSADVHTELTELSELNMDKTKKSILNIKATGGTNFEAGYTLGTQLLEDSLDINPDEFENRIIVLTDAMPNTGRTSGLMSDIKQNARDGINTTFIGIGVDFNTEFIEEISAVRGANYYSVHNSVEFKKRMGEQFDFMVTPLVYDLEMALESDSYSIETVYGTNMADDATNTIMYVNTLFPSASDDNGEVKGGIILLKLKKLNDDNSPIQLKVTYEDRMGNKHTNSKKVNILSSENEYANTGIRKAIVLTRYCNLLKNWIMYEKSNNNVFLVDDDTGINDFNYTDEEIMQVLSRWERQSTDLVVSEKYKESFESFKEYLEEEMNAINDKTLKQEIDLLNELIEY